MNRKRINTKNQLVCRTDNTIKLMTEEVNCEYELTNNQTVIGYNIGSNEQYFINKKDNEVVNTTLHFNPIANKVKSTNISPTEGVISTTTSIDKEGVVKVNINKEVLVFNTANNKRSCTNPNRVINEQSFKSFESLHNKKKSITSIKDNIETNSISTYVEDTFRKISRVQLEPITNNLIEK